MKPSTVPRFALVTGASQGLGKSIAFELANRKINLILVSLPNEGLEQVAESLRELGVEVHVYETDLARKENIRPLAEWVNEHFDLHILVNNAGRGGTKRFLEAESDYLDQIIQLNVAAVALLTHQLLPNLLRQDSAYVLNVSSIASFSPIGYKTVYPATKKFIQHFSEGLHEELRDTPVSVSVLYPGAMTTNPDTTQRIEKQGFLGKIGLLPTDQIAYKAVTEMFGRKTFIVAGWANRFYYLLMAFLPSSVRVPLATRAVRREAE